MPSVNVLLSVPSFCKVNCFAKDLIVLLYPSDPVRIEMPCGESTDTIPDLLELSLKLGHIACAIVGTCSVITITGGCAALVDIVDE